MVSIIFKKFSTIMQHSEAKVHGLRGAEYMSASKYMGTYTEPL